MSRNRILMTCAIASLTLGLSACSSDDGPMTMMPDAPMVAGMVVPTGTEITLPAGLADDGTFTADEDGSVTVEGVGVFECASATCTVVVADNVITVTGDIKVVSLADDLPADVLAALTDAFEEVVELTPLEAAKTAAADEAAAAMAAAVTAGEAADAADTARADVATMQTIGTSGGHAYMAHKYAKTANDESMKAMTASAAAAAADDSGVATRELVKAENARAAADDARDKAVIHADLAIADAANELKIIGTVKTVAGTSIDADAGATTKTTDGNKVITGLIATMNPKTTAGGVEGRAFMPADGQTAVMAYRQEVVARELTIGKVVDSADDMARLMIVTQYAGTKMARVYSPAASVFGSTGTKAGYLTIEDPDTNETDVNNVPLKSEGTWYQAGPADGALIADDMVVAATKGVEVFSFRDPSVADGAEGAMKYVVWTSAMEDADATTTTYTEVQVLATVRAAGDDIVATGQVMAAIPEATDYQHIHFGVWAALAAADKDGLQEIADLSIGFVQNWSGSGLTGDDMPNNGKADYTGNWVATVRARDEDGNGPITLTNGDATLTAYFGMGKITATLTDLATLTGDIAGNTFSGTKAADILAKSGLDATGEFTGEFGGGFYGAKAAEAAGVFNFTSTDKKAGEFRGAFGADRD